MKNKKEEIENWEKGKVNCKKHGLTYSIMFYTDDNKWVKEVCFKCWVEKTIKGLKQYST